MMATIRMLVSRRRLIDRADRLLGLRFSDPPDVDLAPPSKGHPDTSREREATRAVLT